MGLEFGLVISQILAFLILLWIMKRFAWKPFFKTLEARRQKIEGEFLSIEEEKKKLAALTATYTTKLEEIDETARKKMKEAEAKGDALVQQVQEEAQTQARAILQKAKSEIGLELEKAQAQLKENTIQMVMQATEKLVGEKVDPVKDKARVAQFVEEAALNERI